MKFQKGHTPWSKGKTGVYSKEARGKISQTHKGKAQTEEHKKKISEANKGRATWNKGLTNMHSEEGLRRIAESSKGRVSPFKGKTWVEGRISILKGKPWSKKRLEALVERCGKPYARCANRKKRRKKLNRKPLIKNGREYDPNWNEIRKEIYKRDRYICQECGVHCRDKGDKTTKYKIQCHHIDYDVSNNDESNLITLCASCHGKIGFNKVDWMNHYKQKRRF